MVYRIVLLVQGVKWLGKNAEMKWNNIKKRKNQEITLKSLFYFIFLKTP